jgi:hypothetical protein
MDVYDMPCILPESGLMRTLTAGCVMFRHNIPCVVAASLSYINGVTV